MQNQPTPTQTENSPNTPSINSSLVIYGVLIAVAVAIIVIVVVLKKRGANMPIIVLTAKERLKDLIEMEGVDAFMTKPFDISALEEKLLEVLKKNR